MLQPLVLWPPLKNKARVAEKILDDLNFAGFFSIAKSERQVEILSDKYIDVHPIVDDWLKDRHVNNALVIGD